MAIADVRSDATGRVWKVIAQSGSVVAVDDVLVIVESMKMEIPIVAPVAGTVSSVLVAEGDAVEEGQTVGHITT